VLEHHLAGRDPDDDAVSRAARALRGPEDLGPAVDLAVMAAVRAAPLSLMAGGAPRRAAARPAGRAARAWRWLVRPRAVRVSPIGALAAAGLAFVAATVGLRRDAERQRGEEGQTNEFPTMTGEFPAVAATPASRTRDAAVPTRFVFVAPNAQSVTIVGDFNDWDQQATPLVRHQGVWTAEVTLPPGRYAYAFLVDGKRWIADPDAPPAVGDDFGRPSSVVTVRRTDA
jgi:hypothetical protein